MPNKLVLTQATEVSDPYEKLTQLAKKANFLVILELLTALCHPRINIEQMDRLGQAINFISRYSPWRKPVDLEAISFELIDTIRNNDFSLLSSFFTVTSSLPLTWSNNAHYRQYASLKAKDVIDLIATLIDQPTFRKKIGSQQTIVTCQYLDLCTDFLEVFKHNPKRKHAQFANGLGRGSIWSSFLISTSHLENIPKSCKTIHSNLRQIFPSITPYFEISDGPWLLSEELVTISLLCVYFDLLEHAYEKVIQAS